MRTLEEPRRAFEQGALLGGKGPQATREGTRSRRRRMVSTSAPPARVASTNATRRFLIGGTRVARPLRSSESMTPRDRGRLDALGLGELRKRQALLTHDHRERREL